MTLNRDQKGKIALGVLGSVALYMAYSNLFSGPPGAPSSSAPVARTTPAAPTAAAVEKAPARRPGGRVRSEEFHPIWKPKRPEDRVDPLKIDPTLRTDLLAKVMGVEPSGGSRNLFAYGPPPPKPTEQLKGPEPQLKYGPPEAPKPAPPAADPPKPPPPPITLKYYGLSTVHANGKKSAYFLDGDDIVIAAEGETVKRRYKLVRISASSVLMEDIESKAQQSVPLTPEAPSS